MIEYRAWNKDKNIMVYNREDGETEWWDGTCCTDVEIVNGRFASRFSDYIYLMWTTKTDKADKKIYQGDIMKIGGLYEEVCFGEYKVDENEYSQIGFYTKSKYGISPFFSDGTEHIEVVGNIYESKDLLNKLQ